MRDDDSLDFCRIDSSGLHVLCRHEACGRLDLPAGAGIEHHILSLHFYDSDREGDRNDVVGEAAGLERRLHLIGLRIFHKIVFEGAVPDSIVDLGDFDIANLELVEALIDELGVSVSLRLSRTDELKRAIEAERGGSRGGRKYKIPA